MVAPAAFTALAVVSSCFSLSTEQGPAMICTFFLLIFGLKTMIMVWNPAPRCDWTKKAAGDDLRHGLHWFVLMQPNVPVCRVKTKPAPEPGAQLWIAHFHCRHVIKPVNSVKPAA